MKDARFAAAARHLGKLEFFDPETNASSFSDGIWNCFGCAIPLVGQYLVGKALAAVGQPQGLLEEPAGVFARIPNPRTGDDVMELVEQGVRPTC